MESVLIIFAFSRFWWIILKILSFYPPGGNCYYNSGLDFTYQWYFSCTLLIAIFRLFQKISLFWKCEQNAFQLVLKYVGPTQYEPTMIYVATLFLGIQLLADFIFIFCFFNGSMQFFVICIPMWHLKNKTTPVIYTT